MIWQAPITIKKGDEHKQETVARRHHMVSGALAPLYGVF